MVFTGFAALWSLIEVLMGRRTATPLWVFLILAATFVLGLINSFVHARDAWGAMPEGAILSAVDTLLLTAAVGIGWFTLRSRAPR